MSMLDLFCRVSFLEPAVLDNFFVFERASKHGKNAKISPCLKVKSI